MGSVIKGLIRYKKFSFLGTWSWAWDGKLHGIRYTRLRKLSQMARFEFPPPWIGSPPRRRVNHRHLILGIGPGCSSSPMKCLHFDHWFISTYQIEKFRYLPLGQLNQDVSRNPLKQHQNQFFILKLALLQRYLCKSSVPKLRRELHRHRLPQNHRQLLPMVLRMMRFKNLHHSYAVPKKRHHLDTNAIFATKMGIISRIVRW